MHGEPLFAGETGQNRQAVAQMDRCRQKGLAPAGPAASLFPIRKIVTIIKKKDLTCNAALS